MRDMRRGMAEMLQEVQFDGLVGTTHNYAGLSPGNIASEKHRGLLSNPQAAALEGIAKMRLVHRLGVTQAVLPPHARPSLHILRQWGFLGRDEEVLMAAARVQDGLLLRLASSASSMWTANAATVAPSCDTIDGRAHLVVANLVSMGHRSLEPPTTERILRAIFSDRHHFEVHSAIPGSNFFGDEGAANHTRLATSRGPAHLFAWGRRAGVDLDPQGPKRFQARQTLEASMAVSRLTGIRDEYAFFIRQAAKGIDAGGFHSDVLAVGNENLFLMHEHAFNDRQVLIKALRETLGAELSIVVAMDAELPLDTAVSNYPFNSQLLTLPDKTMAIVAPAESERDPACKRFLDRVLEDPSTPVKSIHFVDLRQSMQNGGGPACLRLRVPLTDDEVQAISARVVVDDMLLDELEDWVKKHYRDRLSVDDLQDPSLAREGMTALDELTQILRLGSVYDFQTPPLAPFYTPF